MPKTKVEWAIVKNVRSIRKRKKKTQRDVASCLGVSPGYIGQIETEDSASMYSYDNLYELAKYFVCSMKDFMPDQSVRPVNYMFNFERYFLQFCGYRSFKLLWFIIIMYGRGSLDLQKED